MATANAPVSAGYYRNWAFLSLLVANVFCLVCPFVGPYLRPVFASAEGQSTRSERIGALQVIVVSFTLPCVTPFYYYATARFYRRLREEKIPALLGRILMGLGIFTSLAAVWGAFHAICPGVSARSLATDLSAATRMLF